jgi:peptidyl-dipeptidase Dcp
MKLSTTIAAFWLIILGNQIIAQNPLPEPFNTPHGIIPFEKVEPEHILPAFNVVLKEDRK